MAVRGDGQGQQSTPERCWRIIERQWRGWNVHLSGQIDDLVAVGRAMAEAHNRANQILADLWSTQAEQETARRVAEVEARARVRVARIRALALVAGMILGLAAGTVGRQIWGWISALLGG